MEGEFVLVSKRNSRGKKSKGSKVKHACLLSCSDAPSEFGDDCYEKSMANIYECKCEIESSSFWADLKESWQMVETVSNLKADEIISYGAGSISSNPIARYQFAFLVLLAEHLELVNQVHIYDPIFTSLERRIILKFGFHLITENEECKRKVTKTAVILMLHCGKKMYDNLLQANWNSSLENIILIGNSFSTYLERNVKFEFKCQELPFRSNFKCLSGKCIEMLANAVCVNDHRFPSSLLKEEAPYLYDIISFSNEQVIKNTFVHTDIFNDTSFMTFPKNKLSAVSSDFWTRTRKENGTEDDTEIILKSKIGTFRP